MSGTIINLVIQLIAGVVGGNGAGLKDYSFGGLGNTIVGAISGVGGGQALQAFIPALAGATGGGLDVGVVTCRRRSERRYPDAHSWRREEHDGQQIESTLSFRASIT